MMVEDICNETSVLPYQTKRKIPKIPEPIQLAPKRCNCCKCVWNGEEKECIQRYVTIKDMKTYFAKQIQSIIWQTNVLTISAICKLQQEQLLIEQTLLSTKEQETLKSFPLNEEPSHCEVINTSRQEEYKIESVEQDSLELLCEKSPNSEEINVSSQEYYEMKTVDIPFLQNTSISSPILLDMPCLDEEIVIRAPLELAIPALELLIRSGKNIIRLEIV
jgi:hypothetical protein